MFVDTIVPLENSCILLFVWAIPADMNVCIGENMKQLELSAEKAVEREEKLKDKILHIQQKYKAAEGR